MFAYFRNRTVTDDVTEPEIEPAEHAPDERGRYDRSPPVMTDCALLADTLYYLPDQDRPRMLRRLLRIQNPDGQVVIIA